MHMTSFGPAANQLGRSGAVTLAAPLALVLPLTIASPGHAADSLRGLAEGHGRYFGTELTQGDLSNGTLTGIAGGQFDMVTPGNEMKWDSTEPANGTYATFCPQAGHNGQGDSFQSVNYPNDYLRHFDYTLYIAANGGSNAWDATTSWADDTSWNIAAAWS
jgi:hypothetical protein